MPYGAFLGILFFKNGYTVSKFTPGLSLKKIFGQGFKDFDDLVPPQKIDL